MALLRMGSDGSSCAFLTLRVFRVSRSPGPRQSASDLGSAQHPEVPTSLRTHSRVRRTIRRCPVLTRPPVHKHVSKPSRQSWHGARPDQSIRPFEQLGCSCWAKRRLPTASERELTTSRRSAPPGSLVLKYRTGPSSALVQTVACL